jgi:hypothetical protein
MTSARSTLYRSALMVATAFTLSLLPTASQAYTAEQQQMCSGDAMRLCSSEIPDVDRVTACMMRQRASLSDGCKAVFRAEPAGATEVSYKPATPKAGRPTK